MKERPILMSAPMVRAILSGTKTQTRRIVDGYPVDYFGSMEVGNFHPTVIKRGEEEPGPETFGAWTLDGEWSRRCPYGRPGDRLWARETYFAFGCWETRFNAKKGRDEWHFIDMTVECGYRYHYAASEEQPVPLGSKRSSSITPSWWKRPAIFMPRAASRITLEVTDVRVEQLQDISKADALAEGIEYLPRMQGYGLPDCSHYHGTDPRVSYWSLLEEINGRESVEANPWMWVISFRRLEQEAP